MFHARHVDDTFTWYEYGRPAINTTMAITAEINKGDVDAIYHGGDISYATGYIAVWDFYLDMLSAIAGRVVYLSTVGNHESDCPNSASYYTGNDSGGECGILTTKLLPMPYPATTDEPWYLDVQDIYETYTYIYIICICIAQSPSYYVFLGGAMMWD